MESVHLLAAKLFQADASPIPVTVCLGDFTRFSFAVGFHRGPSTQRVVTRDTYPLPV
jgi:hypothetical protein